MVELTLKVRKKSKYQDAAECDQESKEIFSIFTSLHFEVSGSYKFGEDIQSTLREDQKQYRKIRKIRKIRQNRKISFTTSVRKKMKGTYRGETRSD